MTDPDRVGRAVVDAQLSIWYPCFICAHKPGVYQLQKHVLVCFFLFLSLVHCEVNPLILGSSVNSCFNFIHVTVFSCCYICSSLGCTQTWERSSKVCLTSSGKVLPPWCLAVLLAFLSKSPPSVIENIRHLFLSTFLWHSKKVRIFFKCGLILNIILVRV